jgi:multidrug efflux system membrane fusion protein
MRGPRVGKAIDAIALLLLCSLTLSCARQRVQASAPPAGVPVRAAVASLQDVPLEITAVGNVEAIQSVAVKPRIGGQIQSVAFSEGQNVTRGQLLFTIDPATLQRQTAEQQAELERDTAMEQQAPAVVARDTATDRQSQSEAEVAAALLKDGILSKQRADQLNTASQTAGAALHSDQAAVQAAISTINADRARLRQTQLQLDLTRVPAPISGRAGAAIVKSGNIVRDSDTTLVNLLQLTPIQVSFGVPEQALTQIQRLNTTHPLTVVVSSGSGSALDGQLSFVDNAVDATTGTIRLKATFPNTDETLWPGEFVDVRLRLRVDKDQLIVPASAVQDGLEGKYVWVLHSEEATIAPVTVLRNYKPADGPELAVVAKGIGPGDMVVTEGQLRLTPNVRVSLLGPSPVPPSRATTDHPAP